MIDVDGELERAIEALDFEAVRKEYLANDDFVALDHFLPDAVIQAWDAEVDALAPHIHRNFVPRFKKGGSVGFDTVRQHASTISKVYESPVFLRFLTRLVGMPIQLCPPGDFHACALYCYTEAGDHIGFHYDTSFYKDKRFTILLGARDDSSGRLVYELHTKNDAHEVVEGAFASRPGSLVVFDGDKLHHKVSPIEEGESRFVVTMQYVTDPGMNPFLRVVSNVKDAVAYFGFRSLFSRGRTKAAAAGQVDGAQPDGAASPNA